MATFLKSGQAINTKSEIGNTKTPRGALLGPWTSGPWEQLESNIEFVSSCWEGR